METRVDTAIFHKPKSGAASNYPCQKPLNPILSEIETGQGDGSIGASLGNEAGHIE